MSTVSQATVFVGLDYHAASVQVCALSPDGNVRTTRNGREGCVVAGWQGADESKLHE